MGGRAHDCFQGGYRLISKEQTDKCVQKLKKFKKNIMEVVGKSCKIIFEKLMQT